MQGEGTVAWRAFLAISIAVILAPGEAASQLPSGPAIQLAPTREELEQRLDPGMRPPQPADEFEIEESQTRPGAPADDATSAFRLRGLEIVNSTVYDDAALREIYEPLLDTEVSIGRLRSIADRIEQLYRDDGYVATRVILPPQVIEDGVARLEVFEGKIIHYEINGEIGPVKKQVERLLDNLLTDRPARWSELERYLLLARDLPGISLTGTLRPAGEMAPGGVILVVDIARKAVDGFVSLQNRNAEPTGPFTLSGGVAFNSNTQSAERIGVVGLSALEVPEQLSGFLSYEQNLGNDGLRVYFSALYGYSEPGDLLKNLDLVSKTTIIDLGLEYPMVRSRRFSLWTRGGFQYEDQKVDVGKPGRELLHDELRVLYGGARVVALPPLGGVTRLDVEVRQGLDAYGADVFPELDSHTDFTLVRGEVSHTQPIPPFFEIYLGARGQKSNKPLPSLEEMSLGELTVGRGFEPGALTGDNGFGLTGELRYYPPGLQTWWLQDFSVFGFYDYGRVDDFGNPTGNPAGYEDLSSVGFGVRFQAFETLLGEVYYAQPLERALESADRKPYGGVKFTLTKFF